MAKIYCHVNQCNASVQYFTILQADKYWTVSEKPIKLKICSLKLSYVRINVAYDATDFVTKQFCRTAYTDDRAKESLSSATKTFSHTIKQLLHQYHKILAWCNIAGQFASSFSLNITRSQYLWWLMQ